MHGSGPHQSLVAANGCSMFFREFGELHSEFSEMEPRHFFIQFFGKNVDTDWIFFCPKFELSQCLI